MKTKIGFILISVFLVILCACAPLSLSSKGGKGTLILQLPGNSGAHAVAYDGHSFNFKIEISGAKGFSKVITSEGNDLISEELEVGNYTITATAHYYFDTGYKNSVYIARETVNVLENQETPVILKLQPITSDITFGKNLWNHVDELGGYNYVFCGTLEDLNLELSNPVGGSTLAFTITGTAESEVHAYFNCEFIRFGLWDEDYHPITDNGMWVDAMPGDEVTMKFEILVPEGFSFAPDEIPGILIHYEPDMWDAPFTLNNSRIEQIYRQYIIKDVPLEEFNAVYTEVEPNGLIPFEFTGRIGSPFCGQIYYEVWGQDGLLAQYQEWVNSTQGYDEFWTAWVMRVRDGIPPQQHPTLSISYNSKNAISITNTETGEKQMPTLFHPVDDIVWYTFHIGERQNELPFIKNLGFNLPEEDGWSCYFDGDYSNFHFYGWYDNQELSGEQFYINPEDLYYIPGEANTENRDFYAKYDMFMEFQKDGDVYHFSREAKVLSDIFPDEVAVGGIIPVEITGTANKDFFGTFWVNIDEWIDNGEHIGTEPIILNAKAGEEFKICVPVHAEKATSADRNPAFGIDYDNHQCTLDEEMTIENVTVTIKTGVAPVTYNYHVGNWTLEKDVIPGYDYYLPVKITPAAGDDDRILFWTYADWDYFPDANIIGWYNDEALTAGPVTFISAQDNTGNRTFYADIAAHFTRNDWINEETGKPEYSYGYGAKADWLISNFRGNVEEGEILSLEISGKTNKDFEGTIWTHLWDEEGEFLGEEPIILKATAEEQFVLGVPIRAEKARSLDNLNISIDYWPSEMNLEEEMEINKFTAKVTNAAPRTFTYHIGGWKYEKTVLSGYDHYVPTPFTALIPEDDMRLNQTYFHWNDIPDVYIEGWYNDEALTAGPVTFISAQDNTGNRDLYAKFSLRADYYHPDDGFDGYTTKIPLSTLGLETVTPDSDNKVTLKYSGTALKTGELRIGLADATNESWIWFGNSHSDSVNINEEQSFDFTTYYDVPEGANLDNLALGIDFFPSDGDHSASKIIFLSDVTVEQN